MESGHRGYFFVGYFFVTSFLDAALAVVFWTDIGLRAPSDVLVWKGRSNAIEVFSPGILDCYSYFPNGPH
jgi:hypothetical protein